MITTWVAVSKFLTFLFCIVDIFEMLLSVEAAMPPDCIIKNNHNSTLGIEMGNNSNYKMCN